MKTKKYDIRFFHNNGQQEELPRGTTCEIRDKNDFVIARSTVVLYYKDTFSRIKGRKEALKKALAEAGIQKGDRRCIWEMYKQHFKLQ
jgi:hypothetical protein